MFDGVISALFFRLQKEFTSARECYIWHKFICFGYVARLSQWQWGAGGILLVQMISTCLRYAEEGGGGVSTLWSLSVQNSIF
jgi:hypothetical protein